MSQQQMNFEGSPREESAFSPGYEGVDYSNDYSSGLRGQKLSGQASGNVPPSGQRLALAIVSLALWMVLFVIMIIGVAITVGMPNPISNAVPSLLILGLIIFTGLVIIFNVLFNRKH